MMKEWKKNMTKDSAALEEVDLLNQNILTKILS